MRFAVFGNKNNTTELIEYLVQRQLKPDVVVTLSSQMRTKYKISDASDSLVDVCKSLGIYVLHPNDYSLKEEEQEFRDFLNGLKFGLSVGWQRIIPLKLLECFEIGVFGWHGSMFNFPNGRGRSPINWSIRLGANSITHNLFKYDTGIDTGPIFQSKKIVIKDDDYIADALLKAKNHIFESSVDLITSIQNRSLHLKEQPGGAFVTFPKLTDEDGRLQTRCIDAEYCRNIIRACSRPFPGAFLSVESEKLFRIWRAGRTRLEKILSPGETEFSGGKIFFGCRNGSLVSDDFEMLDQSLSMGNGTKIFVD